MICIDGGVDFIQAILADLAALLIYTSAGIAAAAVLVKNLPQDPHVAITGALDKLARAWEALPPDVQERAASTLGVACAVMAEAITVLGDHGKTLLGPAVAVGTSAFQEVMIWQRPFDGPGGVAAQIEARFPAAVTLLKALMPGAPPAGPPAPPDAPT